MKVFRSRKKDKETMPVLHKLSSMEKKNIVLEKGFKKVKFLEEMQEAVLTKRWKSFYILLLAM